MEIDELKYFVEAAKEENLSRAAKTLSITQSALSHAVRRLEREFGCTLFEKKGKKLTLTVHGRAFAQKAQDLVSQIMALKNQMAAETLPPIALFRIGTAPGEPSRIMVRAWNRLPYREAATLELSGRRSSQILEQVGAKKIEFGICFNPQPHPEVVGMPFAVTKGVAVVRKDHPLLLLQKSKRVESLSDYPLATPKSLPGIEPCAGHPIFKKINSPSRIRYYFDNYDTAAELLLSSDAWAILPQTELSKRPGAFVIVDEKSFDEVVLSLVKHEEDGLNDIALKLVKALTEVAKELGWSLPRTE